MKFLHDAWNSLAKRFGRRTIFGRVLTGYLSLSLALIVLTSGMSYILLRAYTIDMNIDELTAKARVVAGML